MRGIVERPVSLPFLPIPLRPLVEPAEGIPFRNVCDPSFCAACDSLRVARLQLTLSCVLLSRSMDGQNWGLQGSPSRRRGLSQGPTTAPRYVRLALSLSFLSPSMKETSVVGQDEAKMNVRMSEKRPNIPVVVAGVAGGQE